MEHPKNLYKKIKKIASVFIPKRYQYFFKETKRYYYLFETIRKIRPKNIMEIGTWNGRRAEEMINEAKNFYPASEITYYGFDLFEEMTNEMLEREVSKLPPSVEEIRKKLEKTGVKVNLFKGNTLKVLPKVVYFLPKMDFIFIDGGHSIETITNDWRYAQELMRKNSVVIFDDYYFNKDDVGAKSVIEKIDRSKFDVKILPIRDRFKKEWGVLSINFVYVKIIK